MRVQIVLQRVLVLGILASATGLSQQRMGIAAGVLEVAGNAVSSLATYCLDFTRASPSPSTTYRNLLTAPESASVLVNGSKVPLQEALRSGKVEIKGQHISVQQYLAALNDPLLQERAQLPDEVRRDAAVMALLWEAASPAERNTMESELGPELASLGDYTHLQVINHYPTPIKIVFDENTIIGAKNESAADLDIEHIGSASTGADQEKRQRATWSANTMRQQEALAYLGYYDGAVDGLPGSKTEAAIKRFQAENDLATTGKLETDDTARLLERFNHERLTNLNRQSRGTAILTIAFTPSLEAGRYSLAAAGGTAIVTNDIDQLAANINSHLAGENPTNVYVDLTGFSDDRANALMLSLRNKQRGIDSDVIITGLKRGDGGLEVQNLLFQKGAKLETNELRPEAITEGAERGWFRSKIDFTVRVGQHLKRVTLEFVSRSVQIAQQFFDVLASFFRAPGNSEEGESVARLFAAAEHRFYQLHPEVPRDSFKTKLKTQAGTVEMADADGGPAYLA
jgi:peptidoglycan hydrolase-like protein with peptidoglycan-binding domain